MQNIKRTSTDLHQNKGTIIFIPKVVEFWSICNDHSPYADICLKDSNRAAIASANDDNLNKLSVMGDFAIQIKKKTEKGKRVKLLTRDTANCLAQTCYGLVQLSKYLLDTIHQYVLLGNFTTDSLEKLFGKLRQGSGNYFISVQQVLERVTIGLSDKFLPFF